ncbi:TrlF family AAA-like ATPase [Bacillus paralicheniformis]|uniref:TrlF family AAA-like ATPase n=1 Tax=Bacillus paralicheniformis TaxID=1648923 RepID=UPI0035F5805D
MFIGSRWWKFDFHSHTPASFDYGKGENQEELKSRSPRAWLLDYMMKEIDCVAVTDHNSGQWIDILKMELLKMEHEKVKNFRPLTLFPGVEVSVNGGIHLLAIFDPSKTSQDIAVLLGEAGYNAALGKTEETTTKSFSDVVDLIHKRDGIAIPAHVDKHAGLFFERKGASLKQDLLTNGLLAIQLCDLGYQKPQIYHDLKLSFTEVMGSDSHRPEQIGSSYSWVKMEQPNINSLRLALHDGRDGIITKNTNKDYNPNNIRNRYFIKNIIIKDAAKAGRGNKPLEINFSPWLTTLIGGRGSGKSSIVGFLRLVLNNYDLPYSLIQDFENFKRIYKRGQIGMLSNNTEIQIEVLKDNREILLKWNDNTITEYEKNTLGEWEIQERTDNIEERFPIRIFSQKQLYEMTKDPQVVLKLIDKQFDKKSWEVEHEELNSKWLDSRRQERNLKNKMSQMVNDKAELKDIEAKLRLFKETGHYDLLKSYEIEKVVFSEVENIIHTMKACTQHFKESIHDDLKVEIDEVITDSIDKESLVLLECQIKKWNDLISRLIALRENMNFITEESNGILKKLPWINDYKQTLTKYNELLSSSKSSEYNLNKYNELLERKELLNLRIQETEKYNAQYEKQKELSLDIYNKLLLHEKALRDKRIEIIKNWNEKAKDLKIYINELGDGDKAEESFRNIIRKDGNTFSKDIYNKEEKKGLIYNLMIEPKETKWEKRESLIKNLLSLKEDAHHEYSKLFLRHIENLKQNSVEDIDRFLVWFPEDQVILKLLRDGQEENINIGSAGQRTAAMLALLLSLDETPIVIDQPEDDLDTRRITDLVVEGLRRLKTKQQVIVITHNPNIPVNGAAEQIVQLNFARGQINVLAAGALQNVEVRKAVCEVMEGGKEALNNRYFRIFKALGN